MPRTEINSISIMSDSVSGQRLAVSLTLVLALLVLLAFAGPVALVVDSWDKMPSHAHGYVVILVVAYLLWSRRKLLAGIPQAPATAGLLAFLVGGATAFAGEIVSASVVAQFAVVFMLQAAVWAVMGWRYFRIVVGPLCFLYFAIPFGHGILPTMMDWTADATVMALRASGVPVFQENRSFVIPSGSWSVIEACAGVRYLLSAFFIGSVFAYITYARWYKRVIFVLCMLALSIVANWLRAYAIVIAAHLSDGKWGFGMSHLALGWAIFAIVVIASFVIGSRWRDPDPSADDAGTSTAAPARITTSVALLAAASLLGWSQAAAHWLDASQRPITPVDLSKSLSQLEHVAPPSPTISPAFFGASSLHEASYRFRDGTIGLALAYYRNQRQGFEMINVRNEIEPSHTWVWQRSGRMPSISAGVPEMRIEEYSQGRTKAIVASVFWIGGWTTTSETAAKIYQAINLLTGKGDDAAMIFIIATSDESVESAASRVEGFVSERLPQLLGELDAIHKGDAP